MNYKTDDVYNSENESSLKNQVELIKLRWSHCHVKIAECYIVMEVNDDFF